MSKILFVTRHAGAIEWFKNKHPNLSENVQMISHLTADVINNFQQGDTVIGILPVNLASEVCSRGARFIALEMRVPQEYRGKELSPEDMDKFGAKLVEYEVKRKEVTM